MSSTCILPEDKGMMRKIKNEIIKGDLKYNDKLFTGEFVGDFALRYFAYQLHLRDAKIKRRNTKTETF